MMGAPLQYKMFRKLLVLFPPYLVALFTYMGIMEQQHDKNNTNNTNNSIITKVQQHVPKAFMCGCFYWPIAKAINFTFVPTAARVHI